MNKHKFDYSVKENKCFRLYDNPNTWYSYTHGKFYCKLDHRFPGCEIDVMECFKTQEQLVAHIKLKHKMDFEIVTIPPSVDCMLE